MKHRRILNLRLFSLFIFTLFLSNAYAQHPLNLEPLSTNPVLAEKHALTPKNLFPNGSNVFYFMDTLSLPFIDDFSTDKFKDFRLYQYSGIYFDTLHYFQAFNYSEPFPNTIEYVFTKPDTFIVTGDTTFITAPSAAPQFKLLIYDTLSNPYVAIDSIFAWPFIPKMVSVNNFIPTYAEDFVPDGEINNREKIYYIVPTSPNDKSLWTDRNVYVSNSMAVKPPTIGTAVFDGIDYRGMPYSSNESAYGIADYLTSKPIDLSGYLPGDSLYLSFYIQPQGLGFFPEPKDTFVLEFKSPSNPNWKWVWSKAGGQLEDFSHIMIPITANEWFVKGFQFRFKNYAGLAANMDHWLLDYVRLDANRNRQDTLFNDVAFVTRPQSILFRYEEMPARQFKQEEVDQKWEMESANLWNTCKWITYGHTLFHPNGDSLTSYPQDDPPPPGAFDTSCVNTYFPGMIYNDNYRHFLPSFSYLFDVFDVNCCPYQDSMMFTVRHVIKNLTGPNGNVTIDANPGNDTVYRYQKFYNYFAYDDGEAESSFFLGSTGQIAYEFEMNFADTLRAIQFYFNPQKPNVSNNNFELRVWSNLSDTQEDTVYAQTFLQPIYNPAGPNQFTTYILNRPVGLPVGKFYVGWRQNTQFKMNVGFDKNIDNSDKIFYKTTGQWFPFSDIPGYEGSFMIRPIVGDPVSPEDFVSVSEPVKPEPASVRVFPNPSSGIFNYEMSSEIPADLTISVIDLSGKNVLDTQADFSRTLDLSGLKPGIYFARFVSKNASFHSVQKLILTQ